MYGAIPNVAQATVALVAGAASVTILPAPGANQTYRIVGVHLGIYRTSAASVADLQLEDGTGIIYAEADGLQLTGMTNLAPPIPEPGLQITTNSLLKLLATSTAAVGLAGALVYFFVDSKL